MSHAIRDDDVHGKMSAARGNAQADTIACARELLAGDASHGRFVAVLQWLYWLTDISVGDIASSLGIAPREAVAALARGHKMLTECVECGARFPREWPTREEYYAWRDTVACPTCAWRDTVANVQQDARADELAAMPYDEYLQTPDWKARSAKCKRDDNCSCRLCARSADTDGVTLHVHHATYERRGREWAIDLITLCAECHAKYHDKATPE